MRKIVFIDIETSGINSLIDEIICFTAMIEERGKTTLYKKYAKPQKPLSKNIQEITGISNRKLARCKPSTEVKEEFLDLIKDAFTVGIHFPFIESFLGITFKVICPRFLVQF